jgi:hypothetical protein
MFVGTGPSHSAAMHHLFVTITFAPNVQDGSERFQSAIDDSANMSKEFLGACNW